MKMKALIKENAEMKALLKSIKDDLLIRGDIDDCDCTVVNLSSSLWSRLKEVVK